MVPFETETGRATRYCHDICTNCSRVTTTREWDGTGWKREESVGSSARLNFGQFCPFYMHNFVCHPCLVNQLLIGQCQCHNSMIDPQEDVEAEWDKVSLEACLHLIREHTADSAFFVSISILFYY